MKNLLIALFLSAFTVVAQGQGSFNSLFYNGSELSIYPFTNAANLVGIPPSAIVSNGTYIANGTMATNSGATSGAFLTETGTNRAYSFNGGNFTNLNSSNLATGTVPPARLGSGSGGSTKFLREDSSFQTIVSSVPTFGAQFSSDGINTNLAVGLNTTNNVGIITNTLTVGKGVLAIDATNTLQVGTPQLARALSVDTNGNTYLAAALRSVGATNTIVGASKIVGTDSAGGEIGLTAGNGLILNGTTLSVSNSLASVKQTNFVLNTVYSNTSGNIQLVSAAGALAVAAVSGNSSIDLMVDQTGGSTYALVGRVGMSTLITSIAMTYTNSIAGVVSNGANYYFTNTSAGAGNASSLVAGTGQTTTMGSVINGSYSIALQIANVSPADAAVYHIGQLGTTVASTYTVNTNTALDVTRSGTITRVFYKARVASALGTSEGVTNKININNGSVTTLDTNLQMTTACTNFAYSGLSIPVTRGDTISLEMDCPTWATNPTGVSIIAIVEVDY